LSVAGQFRQTVAVGHGWVHKILGQKVNVQGHGGVSYQVC